MRHHRLLVRDDDDRLTGVDEPVEQAEQLLDVGKVQARWSARPARGRRPWHNGVSLQSTQHRGEVLAHRTEMTSIRALVRRRRSSRSMTRSSSRYLSARSGSVARSSWAAGTASRVKVARIVIASRAVNAPSRTFEAVWMTCSTATRTTRHYEAATCAQTVNATRRRGPAISGMQGDSHSLRRLRTGRRLVRAGQMSHQWDRCSGSRRRRSRPVRRHRPPSRISFSPCGVGAGPPGPRRNGVDLRKTR